ncbi:hypothetical protein M0P65_07855 [Candidatus Gracilibacteria bacterium]|jgi:hypothetical protein|nr:hypothetical protein [Candidatus Gracilibacteria bacterium]
MDKVFSIHQPMKSGFAEVETKTYKMLIGKSGKRWLISTNHNSADNIYVEGGPNSDGFGGATLHFTLESGEVISLKGPWHSNSDSLLDDTGYDATDQHLTQGIISLNTKHNYENDWNKVLYIDVLHYDEQPVIGRFSRIKEMANEFAKKFKSNIYYAEISNGGGSSGMIDYSKII